MWELRRYGLAGLRLWESARLLSRGFHEDSPDGVAIGPVALAYVPQAPCPCPCTWPAPAWRTWTCW